MSSLLHSDSFHVKKGGRRKTVSKRRAYVNTPRQLNTKKQKALRVIDDFIRNMEMGDSETRRKSLVIGGLNRVRRLVNDI